jgi:Cu-processing system permease protein
VSRLLAAAAAEFRIALRNRWVAIAITMMVLFAAVLSAAGTAPTGDLGVDRLTITVASLTSLGVYLVPLIALLMSFDAIAGEQERGTLALVLTYPVQRWQLVAAKFLAHLAILALAVVCGYGVATMAAFAVDPRSLAGLAALFRLTWTSLLLGAGFLGLGYTVSALSRRSGTAAALVIALWLVMIVLFDLALLAGVVADNGGVFTTRVFPLALLANPADAFRLFNLAASEATAAAAGIGGAANAIPPLQALLSLTLWAIAAFLAAIAAFRRVQP